ncbi:putative germ cell-less protein [Choanephora cucurbitarum]|uniref:Putative germ cell-less protein n=1 Tax=Choanephora cucurbitarum TaxID=101091 RepID=A0A1C7N089_9FUNG|nr:putative germ cell-less protein [Choanephora cucurbitarum]
MEEYSQQRTNSVQATPQENRNKSTKVTDHPFLPSSVAQSEFHTTFAESKSTSYTAAYSTASANNSSKYDWRIHSLALCRHILNRGLLDGIGSDIQIYIPSWKKTYHLHKLILDQNPYFKLLLQGPFLESEKSQIDLYLENEDNPFIDMESFQFVLDYLYGKIEQPSIYQSNVKQILATCSYFQIDAICNLCVDFILKSLNQANAIDYLLFSNEYMVIGNDRICDAVCAFLCREAYGMSRSILVALPLEWLEKIIESDAFWVPSEFERYKFIKQVITARYAFYLTRKDSFVMSELDTNPECHIICKSIYYMHMTFEQLESIRNDKNPFTKKSLVPEKVLKDALWLQVQLRSRIESIQEKDTKLGMAVSRDEREKEQDNKDDNNDEAYKYHYPIPTDDTTTYTGESAISLASMSIHQTKRRISEKSEQYSVYPPFRFSVEFTDVASLKHGMRVYSDTVFYAGSNWNMYIQKTRSQRKGILQLGVYLHRQSVPQGYNSCQNTASSNSTPTAILASNSDPLNSRCTESSSSDTFSFSKYIDKRKVVKTWFKIYCPTRGPKHALTLFQSSPDNFSVLQSWGWRSTTLCADEEAHGSQSTDASNNSLADSNEEPNSSSTSNDLFATTVVHASNTPNQLQYLQSMYDLRTLNSTSNTNCQQGHKHNVPAGPTLRFTVVMGHV